MNDADKISEKALGKLIRRTLQAGICLSLLSFLLGFICRFYGYAAAGAFLQAGVLLLISTPVVRVAMLVYGYTRAGEYRFALAAATVLILLFISVLL